MSSRSRHRESPAIACTIVTRTAGEDSFVSCALRKLRSAAADQDARDGLPQGDVRQLQESLLLLDRSP